MKQIKRPTQFLRNTWRAFLVSTCTLFVAASAFAAHVTPVQRGFAEGQILIKPKDGVSIERIEAIHRGRGAKSVRTYRHVGNIQLVQLPKGMSVAEGIEFYKASGTVEYAEPDFVASVGAVPNDPKYRDGTLWGLNNNSTPTADISAPQGWDIRRDASGVVVAILDTGARLTHEDLRDNLWVNPGETGIDAQGRDKATNGVDDDGNGYVDDVHGINSISGSGDPSDDNGHGTHVAGTIGAVGDNGKGVVGVCWRVKLMPLKFLDATGYGLYSNAIESIDYAIRHGAKVINNSWSGNSYSQSLYDAVNRARAAGIVFVAAAGNSSSNNDTKPVYPACLNLDNVVAVAATDSKDSLASFSNYGAASVHLGAPGVSIYSCYKNSDSSYATMQGTSMATPHVSGAVALMWAQFPSLSYKQIISRLLAATDLLSGLSGKTVTSGRLNLQRALTAQEATPDLAVSDIAVSPPSGSKGAAGVLTVTIRNNGAQSAANFRVACWFDRVSAPGCGDAASVTSTIDLLAAGTSATFNYPFTFPSSTGSHTAWALVDSQCAVVESDESNNLVSASYTVTGAPDLTVAGMTIMPPEGVAGSPATLTLVIRNDGVQTASNFQVACWFNRAAAPDCGETASATSSVSALAPAATVTFSYPLVFPSQVGSYTAWAFVDSQCSVTEDSEVNNKAVASYCVTAVNDLAVQSVVLNKTKYAPAEVGTVTITVKNQSGTSTGVGYSVSLFRHAPSQVTANSTSPAPYKIVNRPPLAAEATDVFTVAFVNYVGEGNFTFRVFVNASGIVESDETNNQSALSYQVTREPDLKVVSAEVTPSAGPPGTAATLSVTIINSGANPANNFRLDCWLARDSAPVCGETGDVGVTVSSLGAGASMSFNFPFTYPSQSGNLAAYAFVDSGCSVAESYDNNNQATVSYTVTLDADLAVESVVLNKTAYAPCEVGTATVTIRNRGGTSTGGGYTVSLYRHAPSPVGYETTRPLPYKIVDRPSLAAGATDTFQVSFVNYAGTGNFVFRVWGRITGSLEANQADNQAAVNYSVAAGQTSTFSNEGTPTGEHP